jgi:hypothetical protein
LFSLVAYAKLASSQEGKPDKPEGERLTEMALNKNEGRPYRGYGEGELLELRRNLIKESREIDRLIARNRGDPDYTRPDGGPKSRLMMISNDLNEIKKEFDARHRAPHGPRQNLVAVACGCQPPRRFDLPGKVYDTGPITCGNCSQAFRLA